MAKYPLIIGLTGPAKSGCTTTAKLIKRYIKNSSGKVALEKQQMEISNKIFQYYKYLYDCVNSSGRNLSSIAMLDSKIIKKNDEDIEFIELFVTSPDHLLDEYDRKVSNINANFKRKRIYALHQLRKLLKIRKCNDVVIKEEWPNVEYISIPNTESESETKKRIEQIKGKNNSIVVVDRFCNPTHLKAFRECFKDNFFLISLYTDERERNKTSDSTGEDNLKDDIAKCVLKADYSITNEKNIIDIFQKIIRFFALYLKPGCVPPTIEEEFMNIAYSLSFRSSCLKRQVGCVITNTDGCIIGAGWNDVSDSQIPCGLRLNEDFKKLLDDDSLLSPWIEKYKSFEFEDNLDSFCSKDQLSEEALKKQSKGKDINNLRIKRLQFCRSLHAEENAILQAAKYGGMGINNSILYTTTFPCELCAKKIYHSGILKIVYTEPYPSEISKDIFLKDGVHYIRIKQFEGVKNRSFYRLFAK